MARTKQIASKSPALKMLSVQYHALYLVRRIKKPHTLGPPGTPALR